MALAAINAISAAHELQRERKHRASVAGQQERSRRLSNAGLSLDMTVDVAAANEHQTLDERCELMQSEDGSTAGDRPSIDGSVTSPSLSERVPMRSHRMCPRETRTRSLLVPRAQPADQEMASSHLAAGPRPLGCGTARSRSRS